MKYLTPVPAPQGEGGKGVIEPAHSFIIFNIPNVPAEQGEVKRELTTGRNYLVVGRILTTVGEKTVTSEPHKDIQKINFARTG